MARLKFDDIDEWTPSSISIVDEPSHPLCKFEVYEDDEDYVKKSIEINQEGEIMVEETINKEPTVEVSQSFLEKLLGRSILKSEEPAPTPIKKADEEEEEEIPAWAKSLIARIEKLEEKDKTPAPGAVNKSEAAEGEGEASAEEAETGSEEEVEETEESEEEIIDTEEVVSKSIDPDLVSSATSDKSLVERTGRMSNGMTW